MSAQFEKMIVAGFGADRVAEERRLQERGILLAVTDRVELMRSLGHSGATLLILGDATRAPLRAANIAALRSRALPGHHRLRVTRLSPSDNADADDALVRWITEIGRRDSGCLALNVELFDRDALRRAHLAATLSEMGFSKVTRQRSYRTTLALDLAPTADELLKALGGDTRRCIKSPVKHGMDVRPLSDTSFAGRLAEMSAQTFARTGGDAPQLPWESIIAVSAREPTLSRITGVFDPKVQGPESLVSFAWGVRRDGHTTYEAGATTRRKDLGNISLGCAPVWDMVLWAKQCASTWFDFGGVTLGGDGTTNDRMSGISAFKRQFCDNVVDVGEEWVLRPRPMRAAFADLASAAVRGTLFRKRGGP